MRILTSYARLVSCIGSTRGCKFNVSSALKEYRTSTGKWHASSRKTTTGAVHVLEKSTIDDHDTALEVIILGFFFFIVKHCIHSSDTFFCSFIFCAVLASDCGIVG
ncbi:unnamed protein product [Haemonchus placei]|uniref:Secreted protein n=1 Tax=Haemonchus placei TaxID=6290 RepID=A0A0N4VV97_HAEPC|nr:unnamed protein product [Haemonchus placei]